MRRGGRRDPVLRPLTGRVDLHEHLDRCLAPGGGDLDLLGEPQRVHGVDQAHHVQDAADLVALQVPDHVPAEPLGQLDRPGVRQLAVAVQELVDLRDALDECLHAVLGEVLVAQLDQLTDLVDGRVLGHHRQHDVVGVAPDPAGGVGNTLKDRFVSLLQRRLACRP